MFDVLRTRKGKLKDKIEFELEKSNPDIDVILQYVDDYEVSNLETIKKLKRDKKVELNKINGALKQTINAHGPITKELIGSASKRIYGALLDLEKENIFKRIIKWIRK
jgi:hypothetical protein